MSISQDLTDASERYSKLAGAVLEYTNNNSNHPLFSQLDAIRFNYNAIAVKLAGRSLQALSEEIEDSIDSIKIAAENLEDAIADIQQTDNDLKRVGQLIKASIPLASAIASGDFSGVGTALSGIDAAF